MVTVGILLSLVSFNAAWRVPWVGRSYWAKNNVQIRWAWGGFSNIFNAQTWQRISFTEDQHCLSTDSLSWSLQFGYRIYRVPDVLSPSVVSCFWRVNIFFRASGDPQSLSYESLLYPKPNFEFWMFSSHSLMVGWRRGIHLIRFCYESIQRTMHLTTRVYSLQIPV